MKTERTAREIMDDFLAEQRAKGIEPSKGLLKDCELMSELTRDELKQVFDWLTLYILMHDDPDPEFRRELLSKFDTCPCCQHWLGHNKPPTDDDDPPYRRQTSFDFDRRREPKL